MTSTLDMYNRIAATMLGGRETLHITSYPVIRIENGKYYIAVLVFFFGKEDIDKRKADRLSLWAICDVKTGDIIEVRKTKRGEFSDASYDREYDVLSGISCGFSNDYHKRVFAIFEVIREKIVKENLFDRKLYSRYMELILSSVPTEYKRLYKWLSVDFERFQGNYYTVNEDEIVEAEKDMGIEFPSELREFYKSVGYGFVEGIGVYRILDPMSVADLRSRRNEYRHFEAWSTYYRGSMYGNYSEDGKLLFFEANEAVFFGIEITDAPRQRIYMGDEVIADSLSELLEQCVKTQEFEV